MLVEPTGLGETHCLVSNAQPSRSVEAEGDPEAGFEDFYERESQWARRLAFVLVPDLGVADDIAQEAFIRVRDRFDTLANPRAYMRVTIVNLCKKQRRTQARSTQLTVVRSEDETPPWPTIEILDLVDRLPPRQRIVIVLRYFEGLSEKEIAEVLGSRPGTVKSLASRALSRLRQELGT